MAITAMFGFEVGEVNTDFITIQGTASYSTSTVRTGARAIRCNPASGVAGNVAPRSASSSYQHFAINVATMPSVTRTIAGTANVNGINVRITSTGTLEVYNNSTLLGTSSTALTTGTWYWIGIRKITGTSAVFLQINGLDEVTATATVSGNAGEVGFQGTEASAADAYFDDIIFDDAGFISNGKVDMALPISDNTITGVTDNNGVTTNIWDCVDNTPPAGVASANEAANPKAGMHFPASVTCNYLANLETYTTLGIASGDTVLAVQSVVRHGEDIATGTKNLQNVGALTNPTVSGVSVTAGSDGGAHGAEVGLWVTTFGTVTTSPSVTLGTSPTIRTSRTSEARVACLDFMGMNVAWTPGAVAEQVPYLNPMPQLLAQ